jgi:hypothetical protein
MTLYMLEKRDFLQPPLKKYFLQAVTHAALRRRLYFWARYVVAMDPRPSSPPSRRWPAASPRRIRSCGCWSPGG